MIDKILRDNSINPGNTKFVLSYGELTGLLQQVVGETILAILATDTRDITYTTYDRDQVAGVVQRVVTQVQNHWNFKK